MPGLILKASLCYVINILCPKDGPGRVLCDRKFERTVYLKLDITLPVDCFYNYLNDGTQMTLIELICTDYNL